MIDWGPISILTLVLVAVVLPSIVFGMRYVRLPRLLLGVAVTAIFQFVVLLFCSGLGWGWPGASQNSLLLGRTCLGASFGVSGSVYVWILSRQSNIKISTGLILSMVAVMVPDTVSYATIQYPLVGLGLFAGLWFWFRTMGRKSGRGRDAGHLVPPAQK